jgi:glycosyltransferase involved in cell wall biosynthesis
MSNVLVDLHRIGKNPYNGLYTYCFQLGRSLLKLPHGGLKLFYYLPQDKFGIFGDSVNYVNQRSIDKFYRFNTNKYNIWHAATTLSWYKPFNQKTKFIFTIHDLNFLVEDPENTRSNRRYLRLIQERVDRADHIIAVSRASLDQAKNFLDTRDTPVSVIYPGCAFMNELPIEKKPENIPAGPFLFTIGLLQPRKNFHVLMPLLKETGYELVIAGLDNYDYKNVIIEAARKWKVLDQLMITGPITEGEKVWYYKHCKALVFPSFAEGFGLPVVEAMYFGKPVFLSREGSLPEIGGDAAWYFDSFEPEEMIRNFIDGMNEFEDKDPVEKIKKRASLFTYDNAAGSMIRIYQEMLMATVS